MAEHFVPPVDLPPISDELRDFLKTQDKVQQNLRLRLPVYNTLRLLAVGEGQKLPAYITDYLTRYAASEAGGVLEQASLAVEQAKSEAEMLGEFATLAARASEQ